MDGSTTTKSRPGPLRRIVPIVARHRKRIRAALILMGVWWVIVMARGVWMPLPEGVSTSGPERSVARLELLTDVTYQSDGAHHQKAAIH